MFFFLRKTLFSGFAWLFWLNSPTFASLCVGEGVFTDPEHRLFHFFPAPRPEVVIMDVQSRTLRFRVKDPTPTDTAKYIVRYRKRSVYWDWVQVELNKTTRGDDTMVTLDGLHPYTAYIVEVASYYNDDDEGPFSMPQSFETKEAGEDYVLFLFCLFVCLLVLWSCRLVVRTWVAFWRSIVSLSILLDSNDGLHQGCRNVSHFSNNCPS